MEGHVYEVMNYPLVISTPGLSSALSYSLRSVA